MKNIIPLVMLLTTAIFASEYFSTSKISLYENGVLSRIAWYEGKLYRNLNECESDRSTQLDKYLNVSRRLSGPSVRITYTYPLCVTPQQLDSLVTEAKNTNIFF